MRAIKGLLLASAAGLAAVSSASAADLPVKAKPVEYVKVCSLYGAGFFYVPGTDPCLKIGMYLRSDHAYGAGGTNAAPGYYLSGADTTFTREATDFYTFRARINLTTDWRTQTDYGVLRAYAAIIAQNSTNDAAATGVAGILRAFIQFAGFTVGHAVSYFDFFNGADYGYAPSIWGASTGVNGTDIVAYTWQLGNGWSISVDMEDGTGPGRTRRVINASAAANNFTQATGAATPTTPGITSWAQAAWSPDFAGNIRVDQAWGSAQLSAAAHNLSGTYYTGPAGAVGGAAPGSTIFGHPGDEWGFAVQAGLRLTNFLQPRNTFEVSAAYCDGATAYCISTPINALWGSGNTISMGYAVDGVYVNGSGIEKTESFMVQAAYQHYWNAQWRTAVVGGYTEVNYNGAATAMLCGTAVGSLATGQYSAAGLTAGSTCNPDFSQTSVSTRTAWNPHPTLEIGVDLIWYHIDTAHSGAITLAATGARPAGTYVFEDQDRFLGILRVQKTVLP
jgi:hypothetical protein